MYISSTQKKFWTFSTQEEINLLRQTANETFISKYQEKIKSGQIALDEFFTPQEELVFCRIVAETGMRYFIYYFYTISLVFMMILFPLYGHP